MFLGSSILGIPGPVSGVGIAGMAPVVEGTVPVTAGTAPVTGGFASDGAAVPSLLLCWFVCRAGIFGQDVFRFMCHEDAFLGLWSAPVSGAAWLR